MRLSLAITSILVATSLLAVPAVAAPLGAAVPKSITAQTQNGDEPLVTPVQYRRGYRGGYRHHDGGDEGAGIAAAAPSPDDSSASGPSQRASAPDSSRVSVVTWLTAGSGMTVL